MVDAWTCSWQRLRRTMRIKVRMATEGAKPADRGRPNTEAMLDRLEGVLSEVRACEACAHKLPLGPRPIVQIGTEAKLLIAGQAPGRKVHQAGIPFDDPSGDTLRAWLGIDRTTFYDPLQIAILPMAFCYPGRSRRGDLPPSPECAPFWRARLLAFMPKVELTLSSADMLSCTIWPRAAKRHLLRRYVPTKTTCHAPFHCPIRHHATGPGSNATHGSKPRSSRPCAR